MMTEIRCIFCETKNDNVVIEENGYKGIKCQQCGLIYISPRPALEEIVNLYGHDNANISATSHILASFPKRLYAKHHLRIINAFSKSGALLEIGPGAGFFLDEARQIGFNPYGLEFNPIQANFMRNKLSISCEESPLSTSVFGGLKFDVIYHCDVISHFNDPISEFKTMNAIMNDDSLLVFETGNLGEVDQRYFKYIERFQYPDHLFFFSVDNLLDLLEKTGFDVIKIYRYSILPQLKVMKVFHLISNIKNYTNKHTKKENISSDSKFVNISLESNSQFFNIKSFVKETIKKTYQYFIYLLRYKIGYIAFKENRPQTVIVVARKS